MLELRTNEVSKIILRVQHALVHPRACGFAITVEACPTDSLLQPKQFSQRLKERMAAALVRLLGQGRDGTVQELILQQPECPFDVSAVIVGQPAIETLEELSDDRLSPALALLGKP